MSYVCGLYVSSGSLVLESVPGHQPGFQGIAHQLSHPGAPSGSAHSFALGSPYNTLTQLQMQVDKLNPQAHWQPQPSAPPWMWYQNVQLQRTLPRPRQAASPSHCIPAQPSNHIGATSCRTSPGCTPQVREHVYVRRHICACVTDTHLTSSDSGWCCPK